MNTRTVRLLLLGVVAVAAVFLVQAGNLEPPPGPPAPTTKPLSEVEPRLPVGPQTTPPTSEYTHSITEPGSYYLVGDLIAETGKGGIIVTANHVTIDLMGFRVLGTTEFTQNGPYVDGIRAGAVEGITVKNGKVIGFPRAGVNLFEAVHSEVRQVQSFGNLSDGIRVGRDGAVIECQASGNGSEALLVQASGIYAGDGSIVITSSASENYALGIETGQHVNIAECAAVENLVGILLGEESRVAGCTASGNNTGIQVFGGSYVIESECSGNTSAAIQVNGEGNRIDGNHMAGNQLGVVADLAANNLIVRNSTHGNTVNYVLGPGNDVGPIGPAATATSPWANIEF